VDQRVVKESPCRSCCQGIGLKPVFARLQDSAKGTRTIDQHGIEKRVARIRARGEKV
jgi:hypothetical protein